MLWDTCTVAALGVPYERAQCREVRTLSGGEQKRLVLEALLRGPDEVLLLDEPDNYLDVPGKRWLEERLRESPKTVLFVSHDRELLARTATRIVTVELGAGGNTTWMHGGGFATYHEARTERFARLEELRRRWDEEHAKLKALVLHVQAEGRATTTAWPRATRPRRPGCASSRRPARRRRSPREQDVTMRLRGGRTGKRAVVCERLELTGLMKPFDLEVLYGERVAVLGSNGSGKSHFLRLLAPAAATPTSSTARSTTSRSRRSRTPAGPGSARGCGRAGSPRPTSTPSWSAGPCSTSCTAATSTAPGMGREQASRALRPLRAGARRRSSASSRSRAASRRGSRSCCSSCPGATLLLLDEPTDNLDLDSAEALEEGLAAFEGTVLAVTHDRWFARGFDRFLVFGADGGVYESDEPVWDEGRVERAR